MPLTTKEFCMFAAIDRATLKRWKRRYGVRNKVLGRWSVQEIRALEEAICREVKTVSRDLRAVIRRKSLGN